MINNFPRLVAATALLAFASCAISEGKRGCAQSSDCLLGRVCNSGVCEDPKVQVVGGGAGADTAGGESGDDMAGGGELHSPQSGGKAGRGGSQASAAGGNAGENGSSSGETSSGMAGAVGLDGGTGGDAGAASSSAEAGAAGSDSSAYCDPNETPVRVDCFSYGFPPYPVDRVRGLATIGVANPTGKGVYVMATDADSDTVALTWMNASYAFYDLICFDAFPSPARGSGMMLRNGSLEWFMTGRCGSLFQRTLLEKPFGWTGWTNVTLPSSVSSVTDVAATLAPDGTNILYASGGGRVFARHRTGETYAPYGPWSQIAGDAGALLAAATRADGRQQLFTLDEQGHPLTNLQKTSALGAPFEGWRDFDSADLPPLIDIESPSGLNQVEVYALDSSHGLWRREEDGNGEFTPWMPWSLGADQYEFRQLSGAAVPGEPAGTPLVMAAAAPNGVFTTRRVDGTWNEGWERLR